MSTTVYVPTVTESVVSDYRAADTKGKARIRKSLTDAMHRAMDSLDLHEALDYKATLAACTSGSPTEKAPVDYASEVAQRIADLRAAADILEAGSVFPKGISADMVAESPTDLATALESVEASDQAMVIATAKITRSADRNSIQAAFDRAFDGEEADTFLTCQEIANRGALGDYRPSPGAVAARLFPRNGGECTLEGYEPAEDERGVKGATKV